MHVRLSPGAFPAAATAHALEMIDVRSILSLQRAPDELVAEITGLLLRNYLKKRRR